MSTPERAPMHSSTELTQRLREKILDYARERMELDPAPLDYPRSPEFLRAAMPATITESGIGGERALELFGDVLAPASISTDHPGYLSFIPTAATEAATLFDLVVSASSIYGGSWLEGSGAVYAENEVLTWLAHEFGMPEGSGGVFVQGGTIGNLSALVAARDHTRRKLAAAGKPTPARLAVMCSAEAHSSIKSAAAVMDIEVVKVPVNEDGRLTAEAVAAALDETLLDVFAIVATAGTTNFGIVDDLTGIGTIARDRNIWFHVDGAYGLAGALAPSTRHLFEGAALADSAIVDPHKWLFAPFDACALIYRDPEIARVAHTQHGEYLEPLNKPGEWNPSDYAINLTRRVRGLPLWFSMATHGAAAYRAAIEENIQLAKRIAAEIESRDYLTIVRKPELSIVVFERIGWTPADYDNWAQELLEQQVGLVLPSSLNGRTHTRFAIVNPRTTFELLVEILDTMKP